MKKHNNITDVKRELGPLEGNYYAIEISEDYDVEGNEVTDIYLNMYYPSGNVTGGDILFSFYSNETDKLNKKIAQLEKTYEIKGLELAIESEPAIEVVMAQLDAIDKMVTHHSEQLNKFPTGQMGLVVESCRDKPLYIYHTKQFDLHFNQLKELNSSLTKQQKLAIRQIRRGCK